MEELMKSKVMEWCVDTGLAPEKKVFKEQEFHFLLKAKGTGGSVDVFQNIGSDELFVGAGVGIDPYYLDRLKNPEEEERNEKFMIGLKVELIRLGVRFSFEPNQGFFLEQILYKEDLTKTSFMNAVYKASDCRFLINLLLGQEYGPVPQKEIIP